MKSVICVTAKLDELVKVHASARLNVHPSHAIPHGVRYSVFTYLANPPPLTLQPLNEPLRPIHWQG